MKKVPSAMFIKATLAGILFTCGPTAHADAQADSFKARVDSVLTEHHLAKMVDADLDAAKAQVDVERAAYFPKLSVKASTGWQDIERDVGQSATYDPREASVSLNQLVYDFGATSARLGAAQQVAEKENLENILQRQNLILAAVEAHLQLLKAHRVKGYAETSEQNVRTQTQQENARVEAGKGYATDVLQAKAQLAAAEARRVVAGSSLEMAQNRYASVFGGLPAEVAQLEFLQVPSALLPASLTEAEQQVQTSSPDVVAALARAQVAKASLRATSRAEYMPRLDVDVSHAQFEDRDGTEGHRDDTSVTLNLKWSFDAGLKSSHQVKAASAQALSEAEKANYVLVQSLEEARNAWNSWNMSRERTRYLENQVEISKQFLSLARKERDYGRRSLLDILNAETALIDAESSAVEAKIDEVLAAFRLLRATGRLEVGLFDNPDVVVSMNSVAR